MANRDHFRALARRPVSLRATVTPDVSRVSMPAVLVDLGLGGASVEMTQPLSDGQRVCVQLHAPNLWEPLLLDGCVVWQRPAGGGARTRLGLRFEHQSGATLLALVDLIASTEYQAE
jgi:hypothetical protein